MKKEGIKEETKNKKSLILIILCGVLLIAAIVFLVMYLAKPKYEIKINTDGHEIKKNIVVEDNVIKELPELKLSDDEELVAWVNKDNEAMRPNLTLSKDEEISPVIEPKQRETVTLRFVSGTDEKIPDIKLTKGNTVILPVKPTHKTWTFLYWVDKDGFIVLNNRVINEDTTFYAYWFKSDKKEVTISFDTGTDEKIADIKLTQGSKIIFPTPTKQKEGYVFKGWLDKDGNSLTGDYIVSESMKLTADWQKKYVCPENCVPNEDGSKCTRSITVSPTTEKTCPGTLWRGYCLDFNKKDSGQIRQCAAMGNDLSDEVWYTDNGEDWCVAKMPWVEKQVCPAGYEMAETMCSKEETIDCTQN